MSRGTDWVAHFKAVDAAMSAEALRKVMESKNLRARPTVQVAGKRPQFDHYGYAEKEAARRGKVWGLSRKEYAHLREQACTYCRRSPAPPRSVWLDRIDNTAGYLLSNVQPCCPFCNSVRGPHLSVEETHVAVTAIMHYRALVRAVELATSDATNSQTGQSSLPSNTPPNMVGRPGIEPGTQ